MPQSLARILVHLIFSTKNREPFLRDDVRPELHKYIPGILKGLDSPTISIASTRDHVHVLFSLSKNEPLIRIVEEVKKRSSKWMKTKGAAYGKFAWQSGYGAFSVSPSRSQEVEAYLENQQEHHRLRTRHPLPDGSILRHQARLVDHSPRIQALPPPPTVSEVLP